MLNSLVKKSLGIAFLLFFAGCAPAWLTRTPVDSCCYVGVGKATRAEEDSASGIAYRRAVSQISHQIRVEITSQIKDQVVERDGEISGVFKEKISTFSQETIEGAVIKERYVDKRSGAIHCLVYLDKQKWAETVRERKTKLADMATDALGSGDRPDIQLRRISQAIAMLTGGPWKYMRWQYKGNLVCLFDELIKHAASIASNIFIKPRQSIVKLHGCELKGYKWYAGITYKNKPLPGATLLFSFKNNRLIFPVSVPADEQGNCYATIPSFQPSAGRLPIRVSLNIGKTARFLIAAGVALPAAEINLDYEVPALFVFGENKYSDILTNLLARSPAVLAVKDSSKADYIVRVDCSLSKETSMVMVAYRAFASAQLILTDAKKKTEILRLSKKDISATDPTSANRAETRAIEKCIEQIGSDLLNRIAECSF